MPPVITRCVYSCEAQVWKEVYGGLLYEAIGILSPIRPSHAGWLGEYLDRNRNNLEEILRCKKKAAFLGPHNCNMLFT